MNNKLQTFFWVLINSFAVSLNVTKTFNYLENYRDNILSNEFMSTRRRNATKVFEKSTISLTIPWDVNYKNSFINHRESRKREPIERKSKYQLIRIRNFGSIHYKNPFKVLSNLQFVLTKKKRLKKLFNELRNNKVIFVYLNCSSLSSDNFETPKIY